jgi:trk system potassium uptake protein TrkH
VVGIFGFIITAALFFEMNLPFEAAFRHAFFQVVSIITCTGFETTDYLQWPEYAWVLIFAAMFLGGSTGSTAGGIKMARHLLLLKNFQKMFRQSMSSNAIFPIRLNNNVVNERTNNSVLSFISIYILLFVAGSLVLILTGLDLQTASSSVATCMAGIGPGIGTVGPVSNFAHLPVLAKMVLSFIMLVGRLEIFTVFILFTSDFWKK